MRRVLGRIVRVSLRRMGYDLVRYPPFRPGWAMERVLLRVFERYSINCVLDVGANEGQYGAYIRGLGYAGRIVSFEPVSAAREILQARTRGDPAWVVRPEALGIRSERREIHVLRGSSLSSFHEPNEFCRSMFADGAEEVRTECVQVTSLDSVFDECVEGIERPKVYLKMDTQGWDLEVLRGGSRALGMVPAFQSEVSIRPIYVGMPDISESLTAFRCLGYTLAGLYPVNFAPTGGQTDVTRPIEFDAILCRPDSPDSGTH